MFEWISIPVSFFLSIIAIIISIRQYRLSKRTQILRPHSDRLGRVFKLWLESDSFLPHVLDIANIPEDSIVLRMQKGAKLSSITHALQHLETGYGKFFVKLKELEQRIKENNKQTEEFFTSLQGQLEKELGLAKSARERRYAYYRRIISYSLRKIVTGYPEVDPELNKRTNGHWELKWSNASLVIGYRKDCEKCLGLIKKLLASKNIIKEVKSLNEKAQRLMGEREKLKEELRLKVVDYIELGGILKGKCNACSE